MIHQKTPQSGSLHLQACDREVCRHVFLQPGVTGGTIAGSETRTRETRTLLCSWEQLSWLGKCAVKAQYFTTSRGAGGKTEAWENPCPVSYWQPSYKQASVSWLSVNNASLSKPLSRKCSLYQSPCSGLREHVCHNQAWEGRVAMVALTRALLTFSLGSFEMHSSQHCVAEATMKEAQGAGGGGS